MNDEQNVGNQVRDLRIPGGCVACGGDLVIRVGPSGARAYCGRCVRLSRPMLVPGPNGPEMAELAAAA
jgi:hypothetical protein